MGILSWLTRDIKKENEDEIIHRQSKDLPSSSKPTKSSVQPSKGINRPDDAKKSTSSKKQHNYQHNKKSDSNGIKKPTSTISKSQNKHPLSAANGNGADRKYKMSGGTRGATSGSSKQTKSGNGDGTTSIKNGNKKIQHSFTKKRKRGESSSDSDDINNDDDDDNVDNNASSDIHLAIRRPFPSAQQQKQQPQKRNQQQKQRTIVPPPPPPPPPLTTTTLKRVKSSWRMRPLIIDEKLRVFVEGRDDEFLHYDGGDFYTWIKECEAGTADPADGFSYPLIVQDSDLRTVLEIKGPESQQMEREEQGHHQQQQREKKKAAAAAAVQGIAVPTWHVLSLKDVPDTMLHHARDIAVVRRVPGGSSLHSPGQQAHSSQHAQHDKAATTTTTTIAIAPRAPQLVSNNVDEALRADPPYVRYVQLTPDDLDLSIEYDLDEEDEEWLAKFNKATKKSKNQSHTGPLGEEWLEHLIDRMEKEYTAELQRHPEKWVINRPTTDRTSTAPDHHAGSQSASGAAAGPKGISKGPVDVAPVVTLPPIDEIFPLKKCLEAPGLNYREAVIKDVYTYWKGKHEKAGRPLIQRLWYEPPWHRKKGPSSGAGPGSDGGDGDGGGAGDIVFAGHESPLALAGIRKRRMSADEVRSRFEAIRRDLEQARTLADRVRKREKLKKREAQLLREEWASRKKDIVRGKKIQLTKGLPKNRPPLVHALRALSGTFSATAPAHLVNRPGSAVGSMSDAGVNLLNALPSAGSGPYSDMYDGEVIAMPTEDRAARLAARRDARDAAVLGFQVSRPAAMAAAVAAPTVGRPGPKSGDYRGGHAGGSSVADKNKKIIAVNTTATTSRHRAASSLACTWCGSSDSPILTCISCPRCFCFECFRKKAGYNISHWNRALKAINYECAICRGLADDEDFTTSVVRLHAASTLDAGAGAGRGGGGGDDHGGINRRCRPSTKDDISSSKKQHENKAAAAAAAAMSHSWTGVAKKPGHATPSSMKKSVNKGVSGALEPSHMRQPRSPTGQFASFPKKVEPAGVEEKKKTPGGHTSAKKLGIASPPVSVKKVQSGSVVKIKAMEKISSSNSNKKSKGGFSRADIEIILQQPITTPSRQLRKR